MSTVNCQRQLIPRHANKANVNPVVQGTPTGMRGSRPLRAPFSRALHHQIIIFFFKLLPPSLRKFPHPGPHVVTVTMSYSGRQSDTDFQRDEADRRRREQGAQDRLGQQRCEACRTVSPSVSSGYMCQNSYCRYRNQVVVPSLTEKDRRPLDGATPTCLPP